MTARLVIVCPLPEEAAGVVRRLAGRAKAEPHDGRAAWSGRLGGRDAIVGVCGDGRGRAVAVGAIPPGGGVVVAGVAGALTRGLRRGDLLAATEVYDEASGGRLAAADGHRVAAAARALPAAVLTARSIATSHAARAGLGEGWAPAPAAVDLETWPLVEAAARKGRRWAVLRAISDEADEELPAYLEACRRADGSVDRAAVALASLAHPWTLPALARLRRSVAKCAEILGEGCERLARSGWPWLPGDGRGIRNSGLPGPQSIGFRR